MIGDLRMRATLETKIQTSDDGGGFAESWTTLASVWCELRPLSGAEALTGGQMAALKRLRLRIRFRDDVTEELRLVVGARVLGIDRVEDPDGRRRWLDLDCTENVPS